VAINILPLAGQTENPNLVKISRLSIFPRPGLHIFSIRCLESSSKSKICTPSFTPDGPVRDLIFIAADHHTISASRQGRDILLADWNNNPGLKKEYLTPKGVNKMTGPGWL
jgi:hypothetical protein